MFRLRSQTTNRLWLSAKIVVVVSTLSLSWFFIDDLRGRIAIAANPAKGYGTVEDIGHSNAWKTGRISVNYLVRFEGVERTAQKYGGFRIGDPIPVVYEAGNPQRFIVAGHPPTWYDHIRHLGSWLIVLGPFWVGVYLIIRDGVDLLRGKV